jgi:dimethylhistidine N-methyltransferase
VSQIGTGQDDSLTRLAELQRCHMRETTPSGCADVSLHETATDLGSESVVSVGELDLLECAPRQRPLLDEVIEGLHGPEKSLPAKLHYDQRGSELFEQICGLDEYYITRTELGIMRETAPQLAESLGPECLLIEPGSGASLKTQLLLKAMIRPAGYVPVDISRDFLLESAATIAEKHDIEVLPVWADFTRPHPLPEPAADVSARAIYFPGSTVGNFSRQEAGALLERFAEVLRESPEQEAAGSVVVGFDCKKEVPRMEAAYNDAEGVTAEFNLNVLDRLTRELNAGFDRDRFEFRADWDEEVGAIVSRLWAKESHAVEVGGKTVSFAAGESIRMEESHKYTPDEFEQLAATAGLGLERFWSDQAGDFALVELRPLSC